MNRIGRYTFWGLIPVEKRRQAFLRKWHLKCRAVADSLEEAGDRLFNFTVNHTTRSGVFLQRNPPAMKPMSPSTSKLEVFQGGLAGAAIGFFAPLEF